jgi:molybdopterin converting factor small subunit
MNASISLKLYATLSKFTPENAASYTIEPGITVQDVLRHLDIPLSKAKLIFINNQKGDLNTTLKDGDRVGIFPPVGGG